MIDGIKLPVHVTECGTEIVCADGETLAAMGFMVDYGEDWEFLPDHKEKAELIARAVNAYDGHVQLIADMIRCTKAMRGGLTILPCSLVDRIKSALAEAKPAEPESETTGNQVDDAVQKIDKRTASITDTIETNQEVAQEARRIARG